MAGEAAARGARILSWRALSPSTSRTDRVNKLEWYRKYGVDEYWIVDEKKKQVEVYDLTAAPDTPAAVFGEADIIVSRVLPDLRLKVEWLFGPLYQQALGNVFTKTTRAAGQARRMPAETETGAMTRIRLDRSPTRLRP